MYVYIYIYILYPSMFQFSVSTCFCHRIKMVRRLSLIPWRFKVMLTLWGLAILIGEEAPVMAIEIGMWRLLGILSKTQMIMKRIQQITSNY